MSKTQEPETAMSEWGRMAVNPHAGGVRLSVHVKPKSSRSAILGVRDRALEVALTSPPADGAANAELQRLLARALGVTQRDVSIVAGSSSRQKVIEVNGVSPDDAVARLSAARR
jgi:hypothetical protein